MKDTSDLHPITRVLATVAKACCYHPDDFEVFEVLQSGMLTVKLCPHMGDIRLLIGADGRQSRAYNYLADVMARRHGLEEGQCYIEESYLGEREERSIEFNPEFTPDAFLEALTPVVRLALGLPVHSIDAEGQTYKAFVDAPEEDVATVAAIGDVLFPLGRRNGVRAKVFTLNSKFVREQRKREGVA
jgi:predicted RNA-binding protein YlqC (UPF0109 family)